MNSVQFDAASGVGYRMAISLLQRISQLARQLSESATKRGEVIESNETGTNSIMLLFQSITEHIGITVLASTARAFFYGRLVFPSKSADVKMVASYQHKGPYMPMVQRIGSTQNKIPCTSSSRDGKPHNKNPMRVFVIATLLCGMFQRNTCADYLDDAIIDTIPIVLSLLDDAQPINQGIGAVILVSIMEALTSIELKFVPTFVGRFHEMLNRSFEAAIQLCGREDATILTVTCLAQSKWLGFLNLCSLCFRKASISPSTVCTMTRKATADLLVVLGKQTQSGGRDGNDVRIAGALVSGINPLLAQLSAYPEAASVEIARVALSTLLPLIGWQGMGLESRTIQIAALGSLLSLMDGSYPVMPHHGTRIMVEVFSLLHRSDKDAIFINESKCRGSGDDEVSTTVSSELAEFTAAVALVLCCESAEAVLSHIEAKDTTAKQHLDRCIQIRFDAKKLTEIPQ